MTEKADQQRENVDKHFYNWFPIIGVYLRKMISSKRAFCSSLFETEKESFTAKESMRLVGYSAADDAAVNNSHPIDVIFVHLLYYQHCFLPFNHFLRKQRHQQ